MTRGSFRDLQTRGFVLIRGFLSAEELELLRQDIADQPADAGNLNYRGIAHASRNANLHLLQRAREVMTQVAAETDLRPDVPFGAAYFKTSPKGGVNFPWHQDHESFFAHQNHYDYLNIYIPIIKPRADKSNLSVIPFDTLKRECPKGYEFLVRNGATRFVRLGRRPLVWSDDDGRFHFLGKDLDQFAESPMLSAGDALILRGDMIHRTQDQETERVAVSFRVSSSAVMMSRRRLADGGWHKARMMSNNAGTYQRMFMAFDAAGKDEVPLVELQRLQTAVPLDRAMTPREFMKFLIKEKRRARILTRFLPRAAVGVVAAGVETMYDRYSKRRRRAS